MKKIILLFIAALSTYTLLLAQDAQQYKDYKSASPTGKVFNNYIVNHRHIVYLKNREKMIIELSDINGYDALNNIDSILKGFQKELKPFTDTLHIKPGSVCIDYSYYDYASHPQYTSHKYIRIKKYAPDGSLFLNNNGNVSYLKLDQDTIKIFFRKQYALNKPFTSIQVTFLLNNYENLEKYMTHKGMLQHYIDTMATVAKPKKNKYSYQSSIFYHPYLDESKYSALSKKHSIIQRFRFYKGLTTSEYTKPDIPSTIGFNVDVGAGLVRDKLAPMAEAMLEYRIPKTKATDFANFIGFSVTPYLFFDRNTDGSYKTYDNWFINAEFGSIMRNNNMYKRGSIGIGYLITDNGPFFRNTTMKVYMNFTLINRIVISPQVIFTNNFKELFPGITIKGFLNRPTD